MLDKLLFLVFLFGCGTAVIPPYIKVCKKNDPNLSQCITDSINHLRPKLKRGIPELNVPPLEPLPLSEIKLRSGSNQAQINANISNLLVHGPATFKILHLKSDLARTRFLVQLAIPVLNFEGDYDIDMNILIVKYKGQGPITGKFTNYLFDILLKGDKVKRDSKTYIQFRNFTVSLHPGQSELDLGNLFGENGAVLRAATQEIIKENTNFLVDEIRPALEASLSEKFTYLANSITKRFTYEELFPDS